jgi:glutathione S-transferase
MIQVYGRSDSSNSAKVYWLLDEIGMAYERIDCGGRFGGNTDPAYLAMNPHGKVPTVVDGDLVVWESNAILRYLASQYQAGDLWPATAAGRAAIDKWMDWSATALVPALGRLRKAMKAGEEEIKAATPSVFSAFSLLDAQLQHNDYMAGRSFSLADIAAGPAVRRWFLLTMAKPELGNLTAYFERLCKRPPFAACIVEALK